VDHRVDPGIHTVDQIVNSFLSNGLPTLPNGLKETLICLLAFAHIHKIRIVLMDPLLEDGPKVFNWVQIGTVRRPFYQRYALIFELFLNYLGCMDFSVILHENPARFPYPRHLVVEYSDIEVGGIS
jgi:hypothetical protein